MEFLRGQLCESVETARRFAALLPQNRCERIFSELTPSESRFNADHNHEIEDAVLKVFRPGPRDLDLVYSQSGTLLGFEG